MPAVRLSRQLARRSHRVGRWRPAAAGADGASAVRIRCAAARAAAAPAERNDFGAALPGVHASQEQPF